MFVSIFSRLFERLNLAHWGLETWWAEFLIMAAIFCVGDWIAWKVFGTIHRRVRKGSYSWLSNWATAIRLPLLTVLLVAQGVALLQMAVGHWFGDGRTLPLDSAWKIAAAWCGFWFVLRLKKQAEAVWLHSETVAKHLDVSHLQVIGKLIMAATTGLALLVTLQAVGMNVQTLVTVGGFSSIAIGFAGKEVFANLFSGLMLYLTRPFKPGDFVTVPSKSFEGFVERIGWYMTEVRGRDRKPNYVPNALFSTAVVVNVTRTTHRRIDQVIALRYQDMHLVDQVAKELREMLKRHPGIEQSEPIWVYFKEFGDSSIDLYFQAYTKTNRWEPFLIVQHEVMLEAAKIVERCGAGFPYPTQTLELRTIPDGSGMKFEPSFAFPKTAESLSLKGEAKSAHPNGLGRPSHG